MRKLTDHIVSGDQAVQLQISVIDDPGAGGANHCYAITGFSHTTNPSAKAQAPEGDCDIILFQNGPIKEFGVNGVTQEALLAIVIDRLRSFQAGPFSCRENAIALTHCEDALMWLRRGNDLRNETGSVIPRTNRNVTKKWRKLENAGSSNLQPG